MLGMGFGEILIIAVVLLVAVGPKSMPTMIKTVGGAIRQLRQASAELRKNAGIDELLNDEGIRDLRRDPLGIKKATGEIRRELESVDREVKEGVREGLEASAAAEPRSKLSPSKSRLSDKDRVLEVPDDGVDLAHASLVGKHRALSRMHDAPEELPEDHPDATEDLT